MLSRQGIDARVVAGCLLLTMLLCGSAADTDPRHPGTRAMAVRLQRLIAEAGLENPNARSNRAVVLREKLTRPTTPQEEFGMRLQLALDLFEAGDCGAALKAFQEVETFLRGRNALTSENSVLLRTYAALCHLRMGEQTNCLLNHTTDSCLAPIREGGIHRDPTGSRGAITELTRLLELKPDDLRYRWLLNIAAMTLGEWPDQVPPRWRIEPRVFESEYPLPRFVDVAGTAGVAVDGLAGGSVVEDFDGDGLLDLMCSSMDWSAQVRFLRNQGDGTFDDRTAPAGLMGEVGGLNMNHCDYDNDGHADVLILRGGWQEDLGAFPNSLLRNRGDGTFEDVTERAGLLSFHPTQTAVWFDYNGDGWVDLFIGNETTGGRAHPCELYRNNRDGTFTECAEAADLATTGFVKAVASGDFNNDGRPDLFLSVLGGDNLLFRNDGPKGRDRSGDWRFTEVGKLAGVTEPIDSFPAWFFDYDNDGWPDLFVSGYFLNDVGMVAADYLGLPSAGARARLYRNQGDGTFEDVSRQARVHRVLLTMGSNFGDLDNDGWLDFYVGTGDPDYGTLVPNRMFRNAEGKRFQDVTTAGGFGHLQKGHGVSFADFDNDGDQDIYEVMGGAVVGDNYRNVLFENPGGANQWVTLKLEGTTSNRAALGVRVKLVVNTSDGRRTIHRTVTTGGSFGDNPFRVEVGLGRATAVETLEITWPATGSVERIAGVELNGFYRIKEGETLAERFEPPRYRFAHGDHGHHHPSSSATP